jgi:hypothetical protein
MLDIQHPFVAIDSWN